MQFFDTMIVASSDKDRNKEPSKSTSWKVLETVMSHLNGNFFCSELNSYSLIYDLKGKKISKYENRFSLRKQLCN